MQFLLQPQLRFSITTVGVRHGRLVKYCDLSWVWLLIHALNCMLGWFSRVSKEAPEYLYYLDEWEKAWVRTRLIWSEILHIIHAWFFSVAYPAQMRAPNINRRKHGLWGQSFPNKSFNVYIVCLYIYIYIYTIELSVWVSLGVSRYYKYGRVLHLVSNQFKPTNTIRQRFIVRWQKW